MTAKSRDWHFEALRIFAMFLILVSHFLNTSDWRVKRSPSSYHTWPRIIFDTMTNTGQIGVCLFVLISAYFLARSKSSPIPRMIKLWVQVFLYSLALYILWKICRVASLLPEPISRSMVRHPALEAIFPVTQRAYWFISAFFVVMAIGPFINVLLDNITERQAWILAGIVVWVLFFWFFLNQNLRYFNEVSYLLAVYLFGNLIARYNNHLPKPNFAMVMMVSGVVFLLCVLGTRWLTAGGRIVKYMGYPGNLLTWNLKMANSAPTPSLIIALTIFLWVVNIPKQKAETHRKTLISRIVLTFSPSVLGVYLIHCNHNVWGILWRSVNMWPEPLGLLNKFVFLSLANIGLFIGFMVISFVFNLMVVGPLSAWVEDLLARTRWKDKLQSISTFQ
ncbi:symporter [Bifidobacterium aemilianum]|uniref:Symporter n=1 Tax=Bifidobacterium aemilianum TaxID=2493120 RepID=A0A366K6W2_9BIFI|nr:acyltransferase [Bifidobacterium aemilianum]RBP97476.1 symporter [Bifidobacterium aemilianum]